MKKVHYYLLLICSLLVISCSSTSYLKKGANGENIDTRLVGEWAGSEKDQQEKGLSKEWVMERNDDGTFVLHFTVIENGKSRTHDEEGNWWILDDQYYEFHEDSGKTDVYTYKVLNKDQIKFSSKELTMGMTGDVYEFVDTRKK